MPIFEYHCDECGKDFEELLLSRAAEAEVVCRSCGSKSISKMMSGAAVRMGASASAGGAANCPAYDPGGRRGGCPGGGCGCH